MKGLLNPQESDQAAESAALAPITGGLGNAAILGPRHGKNKRSFPGLPTQT